MENNVLGSPNNQNEKLKKNQGLEALDRGRKQTQKQPAGFGKEKKLTNNKF